MKIKIILMMIVIIIPIIVYFTNTNNKVELTGNISDTIIIKDNNIEITINYPLTKYTLLDKEIHNIINKYKDQFYNDIKDISSNNKFTLNINYIEYTYNNYISYLFYIESYLGGAHPNHQISTINYNKDNNIIIDINSLVEDNNNNNILNTLSNLSREYLNNIEIFKDSNINNMMIDGTTPSKDNYKNFIITKDGLMIIFSRYQIAPYYFGEYHITIPYNKLKKYTF